jgi:predicted small metal-binding protein
LDEPSITVRCVCGWETSGPEEDVVATTIDHGLRVHNMAATREEVLAMAIATTGVTAEITARTGAGDGT